ncbi:MAG: response regulator protein GacA [Bacteroidota bacterium]|jgi:DNA-binding NarL/FixJ family response regulator
MIKLMMADDHVGLRDNTLKCLPDYIDVNVIGSASSAEECITLLKQGIIPDVLILDINFPKGIPGYEVAKYIKQNHPTIAVVAYSGLTDKEPIRAMIHLGVKGFVIKTGRMDELCGAIHKVLQGEFYYPSEFLFTALEIEKIKTTPIPWLDYITPEKLIPVQLMAEGLLQNEAAVKLNISESTFRKRMKTLYDLTKTNSSIALADFLRKIGLRK